MLKVGITGGIGSGKTMVCQVFETLGIPVFYADAAAKELMNGNATLVAGIQSLLGADVYTHGQLDRKKVSALVFAQPEKLQQLNALVHPAVFAYAAQWMEQQTMPYAIKEAAIFFETGSHQQMDIMIGVDAPLETRIQRAMQRGNVLREDILSRMAQQMDHDEKMKLCDYVIVNDGQAALIPQVLQLHEQLLQHTANNN